MDMQTDKKALIIGTYAPWIEQYTRSLTAAGIDYDVADPTQIVLWSEQGLRIIGPDKVYADHYDYIIPLEEDYEHLYYSFALDSNYGQAAMLNKRSILSHPNFSNKFYQYQLVSRHSGLRVPASHYSINAGLLSSYVEPGKTIAKITQSARGRGVFKLSSAGELVQLADEYGKRMLIQEFFASQPVHDYRTLLINGKSQGSVCRTADHGFTTNGTHQVETVPEAPYVAALEALALSLQIDYCGIDYMVVEGEPIILEINRFAYMGSWKEVVGPDIAGNVVKLLQAS